jgi:beta propeller repeat protein
MQPRLSPRARSLGVVSLAVVLAALLLALTPGLARAAVACQPIDTWVTQEFPVTSPAGDLGAPATDGATIYWAIRWAAMTEAGWDVLGYTPASDSQQTVAGGDGDQTQPAVAAGFVVWVEADGCVWGLDTNGGVPFQVSTGPASDPATDGRYVAWTDSTNGAESADVLVYDRQSGETQTVAGGDGAQCAPAVSDGRVVWQDDAAGTWDVFGYDLASAKPFTVCSGEGNQTSADIFDDVAVWQDDRYGSPDVFGAWFSFDGGESAATPARATLRAPRGCDDITSDGDVFPIALQWGDQVDPSVDGPLVVWSSSGCEPDQADLWGYSLEDGEQMPICLADGAQTHPDVGGQLLTWLDGRDGAQYPAVYGATWAPGGDQDDPQPTDEWTADDLITLFLSVFKQLGVFSDYRYSFDGGATWSDWQPFDDIDQVKLPDGDGPKTISLQFRTESGTETPVVSFTVYLDTHGPAASACDASAHRGRTATLRYVVKDRLSPKAHVTLRVRNARGAVVRTIDAGTRATGRLVATRFACTLRRGTYRVSVLATDLAGNHQVRVGRSLLTVR